MTVDHATMDCVKASQLVYLLLQLIKYTNIFLVVLMINAILLLVITYLLVHCHDVSNIYNMLFISIYCRKFFYLIHNSLIIKKYLFTINIHTLIIFQNYFKIQVSTIGKLTDISEI